MYKKAGSHQAVRFFLVCQKSDCQKRGSGAVCKALENALNCSGLAGEVIVQKTGCLKQCKAGPNIVVMPDKTRYTPT
ncbi:MAG: (2Fe-2S) ferredoxin domain-containing protein [Microcoleus sp.]